MALSGTVGSKDAAVKRTGMYLQRVPESATAPAAADSKSNGLR